MLDHIIATIIGIAIGYVVYKTFFDALRQTIQQRLEKTFQERKRRREVQRATRYRLLIE